MDSLPSSVASILGKDARLKIGGAGSFIDNVSDKIRPRDDLILAHCRVVASFVIILPEPLHRINIH